MRAITNLRNVDYEADTLYILKGLSPLQVQFVFSSKRVFTDDLHITDVL